MHLFCQWLTSRQVEVVTCRDPGSTPLGERVREILLTNDEQTSIAARSEMLLYMAARAQLVDEVIRPALAAGKTVVSDRFLLANVVYQGDWLIFAESSEQICACPPSETVLG